MKDVKSYIRKIDVFGVPYTFKYRSQEKYTSATGGLFVYYLLVLLYL